MCTYVTSYTEWRNIRTGECLMNNILQYGRGTIYLHFNNKQLLYSDTWQNRDSLNGCKKMNIFLHFFNIKKTRTQFAESTRKYKKYWIYRYKYLPENPLLVLRPSSTVELTTAWFLISCRCEFTDSSLTSPGPASQNGMQTLTNNN